MTDGGLRQLWRKYLKPFHWTSIESHHTMPGIPDMHFGYRGASGWIEDKGTSGTKIHFQPAQVGWLLSYTRTGNAAFVAVRREIDSGPRRGPKADELYLFAGTNAGLLDTFGIIGPGAPPWLGRWKDGPTKWDWNAIAAILTAFPRPDPEGAPEPSRARPVPGSRRPSRSRFSAPRFPVPRNEAKT